MRYGHRIEQKGESLILLNSDGVAVAGLRKVIIRDGIALVELLTECSEDLPDGEYDLLTRPIGFVSNG